MKRERDQAAYDLYFQGDDFKPELIAGEIRELQLAFGERLLAELGYVKSDTTDDWFAGRRIDCGRAAPSLADLLDGEDAA